MELKLIIQGDDIVTVPEDKIPVIVFSWSKSISIVAMIANFLRCGCSTVQILTNVSELDSIRGIMNVRDYIEKYLKILSIEGECFWVKIAAEDVVFVETHF